VPASKIARGKLENFIELKKYKSKIVKCNETALRGIYSKRTASK
jgi:hypothetical protein